MLVQVMPWLLGAMIGAVVGLGAWSLQHSQDQDADSDLGTRDDVLLAFTLLASLALLVFFAYLFLSLNIR